jgi:hypothetical protein
VNNYRIYNSYRVVYKNYVNYFYCDRDCNRDPVDGILVRCVCGGYLGSYGVNGGCIRCGRRYNLGYYTTEDLMVTYLYG